MLWVERDAARPKVKAASLKLKHFDHHDHHNYHDHHDHHPNKKVGNHDLKVIMFPHTFKSYPCQEKVVFAESDNGKVTGDAADGWR